MKAVVGLVNEVYELSPKSLFSTQKGVSRYIQHYPKIEMPHAPEQASTKLREYLFKAVKKRLDDGAVGGMLISGGLDSSIIASIANKIKPDLPAFTVAIDGAPDLENAKIMAEFLDIEHRIYKFNVNEIMQMVPNAVRILESFDEDCVSGSIANLMASSLASKHTNCILTGEGADELFGGYHLLKNAETEDSKLKTMNKLIEIAYNTALQRLDRSMMANSINYRTPFIDPEIIAFALQTPVEWKIRDIGRGKLVEKWILREAFKDMLPEKIYRRAKLRFSAGTGIDNVMDKIADNHIDKNEFNEETRNTPGGNYLNSPKELWYYKIFKENYPALPFEKIVSRWNPNK